MPWPTASDYFEAVQNPLSCFADDELRRSEAACNSQGMPILYAGNFASVFQVQLPEDGRSFAIKCFTRKSARRQERYRHISAHLQQAALPFTVPFVYLEQGIRVRGEWYPILKMDWIHGQTLNQFVNDRLERTSLLRVLGEMWVKLAQRLHEAQITHADLQHNNVLLIPGSSDNRAALKLVDYDGMYLAALQKLPSGELGHPTYQSPLRLATGYYGPDADRFSHLVIYTALRALMAKGRPLWQAYDNGDNLLFTPADFKNPRKSKLLQELWRDGPEEVRVLAGRLALAAEQPLAQLPLLHEMTDAMGAWHLTPGQEREADLLLNAEGAGSASRVPALRNWPTADDYRSAMLQPSSAFRDAGLRDAVAVPGGDGLPISFTGPHGIVFQMRSADGKRWAVKCFTSMVPRRQAHLWAIGAHVQGREIPFMVPFECLDEGILIRGERYPIVKMAWVEGQPLHQFVARIIDQPAVVRVVRDSWERLANGLKSAELIHGDLQPSNILVVAGEPAWRMTLKLVDYDGMRIPALADVPSAESGHPVYQHPRRAAPAPLLPQTDHFATLVVYTALRALVIKGAALWRAYDKGDNLLFCAHDFRLPWESRLLRELWQDGPDELRFLAGRLILALEQPPASVPALSEVLAGPNVAPLTPEEIERVQRMLHNPEGEAPSAPTNLDEFPEKPKTFLGSIAAKLGLGKVKE